MGEDSDSKEMLWNIVFVSDSDKFDFSNMPINDEVCKISVSLFD